MTVKLFRVPVSVLVANNPDNSLPLQSAIAHIQNYAAMHRVLTTQLRPNSEEQLAACVEVVGAKACPASLRSRVVTLRYT